MSAWIVDQRHIDLVTAALVRSEITAEARVKEDELGQRLWQINHDSVNARYGEEEPCPQYRFTPVRFPDIGTLDGAFFLSKAVRSYRYQSCEHARWDGSDEDRWTAELLKQLNARLAELGAVRDRIRGWTFPGSDAVEGWTITYKSC